MKVYLPDWLGWTGPYQIADWLRVFGVDENRRYAVGERLSKIGWLAESCQRFQDFKVWLRKRRTRVRIDPWDTIALDSFISTIVAPALRQMRECGHGAPWTDDEDVPEELRSTSAPPKEHEYDTDDNHFKRWDWILGEMIFAHEFLEQDKDEEPETISDQDLQKRIDNGFRLFGKYYRGLWT